MFSLCPRLTDVLLTSSNVGELRLSLAVIPVVRAGTLTVRVASLVLQTETLHILGVRQVTLDQNFLTWFLQRPSQTSLQSPFCPLPS